MFLLLFSCLSHHLQKHIQPGNTFKRDESPLVWEKEGREERKKGVVSTTGLGLGVLPTCEGCYSCLNMQMQE